ncbi:MAG: hypothetical protein COB46_08550 [Rhodospirillaceae bacterium]|nr:MAG: hypothetical protein COB46_08550 [Rhodospirillaceae bacterium]
MACYIVNKNAQSNGDHEVHKEGCSYMPDIDNQLPLGEHASCNPAVTKAKKTYATADGCAYCCSACHNS